MSKYKEDFHNLLPSLKNIIIDKYGSKDFFFKDKNPPEWVNLIFSINYSFLDDNYIRNIAKNRFNIILISSDPITELIPHLMKLVNNS